MPFHRIDQFFPLIITQHIGAVTDEEWENQLKRDTVLMNQYLARGDKTISIYDMTFMKSPTPTQRELAAHWMRDHLDGLKATNVGNAFLIPNMLIRGVLQAVFWIQRYPLDYKVTKGWDAAIEWCAKTAQSNNVSLPDGIVTERSGALQGLLHQHKKA